VTAWPRSTLTGTIRGLVRRSAYTLGFWGVVLGARHWKRGRGQLGREQERGLAGCKYVGMDREWRRQMEEFQVCTT
jgi:hypothetical protein